jgi:hypothetical protein
MRSAALALGLSLVAGSALAAQLPDGGVTAGDLANVLRPAGYAVELQKDPGGDPFIRTASGGVKWGIAFYDCELPARERCRAIQFGAIWNGKGAPVSADKIADWNRSKRYAKAFLAPTGDPVLEMDLLVAQGVTTEFVRHNVDLWTSVVGRFPAFVSRG